MGSTAVSNETSRSGHRNTSVPAALFDIDIRESHLNVRRQAVTELVQNERSFVAEDTFHSRPEPDCNQVFAVCWREVRHPVDSPH